MIDGKGKSSQVPQFFLDVNEYPILCTQPRRFAVVAIARTVANARNCVLGGEVGFHIGHSKLMTSRYCLFYFIFCNFNSQLITMFIG